MTMGGLTRFERRCSGWVRMRDAMHWRAYDSQHTSRMRRAALAFVTAFAAGFVAVLALISGVLVMSRPANAAQAADAIPHHANLYKLTLKREAQRVWGLQAPVATFAAQVHQESRWRADATSPVGAHGLSQFMPATARWMGSIAPSGQYSLAGAQTGNPTWSLRALVTYNLWLSQRIQAADGCERMAYTLSAYNGGLGWVYKRQRLSDQPGICLGKTCTINPGITPANQRENEHYPRVILLRYEPLYERWGAGSCA
jgi:soluble lytic murein transglycosylase-like protein